MARLGSYAFVLTSGNQAPSELAALHTARIDANHPQNVPAQSIIARMGDLNAHHVDFNNVQNPEARSIHAALTYYGALARNKDVGEASAAAKQHLVKWTT